VLVATLSVSVANATAPPAGWKTYRSEQFGYELSYPPDMELRAYFGGSSGDLRDPATGEALVELEVWPGDLCPRERPGTTAKALGVERAAAITQADGDGSSSSCGRPVTVREWDSSRGVRFYELQLTCRGEHTAGRRRVHEALGRKGPTFFADVSQPWRARILMVDPVGADPRMAPVRHRVESAVAREILDTLTTFPLPDPKVVCIEDLSAGSSGSAHASP